jgi:hypothetical protein
MKKRIILGFLVLIFAFTTVSTILAVGDYQVNWWSVDGGGGTSQGGDYAVSGTIGQPDTSPLMSGDDFTIVGGFWGGAMTPPGPNLVYLPLVIQ